MFPNETVSAVIILFSATFYVKPNTHRRRDATVELSRVGGVHEIRNYLATVSTSLNKFANSESSCVVTAV